MPKERITPKEDTEKQQEPAPNIVEESLPHRTSKQPQNASPAAPWHKGKSGKWEAATP